MEWQLITSPKKSKLKLSSACKTMGTVCRVPKDGYGSRVGYRGKPSHYLQMLHKVSHAVNDKCPGKKEIILQHGKAPLPTANSYVW